MQFRWVAAITVWTFISGPLLGPPHAPILQRDNQRSPLRQVAEIVETTSPQIIKRQELQRRVALYANAEGRPSGDVNSDVQKIMDATTLPPGYRFDVGGQAKDQKESFQAAMAALGLAVIFIYLILASQFASFVQPVAIMASLPFSLIGVFLALLLTGTTLNMFSMIGFIMLMGLVTKNAILPEQYCLQPDHFQQRQKSTNQRIARLHVMQKPLQAHRLVFNQQTPANELNHLPHRDRVLIDFYDGTRRGAVKNFLKSAREINDVGGHLWLSAFCVFELF